MTTATFSRSDYGKLKHAYNKAIKGNKKEFTFDGNVYIIEYAKYLCEYLADFYKHN
jgi:hypothetical protein